MSSSRPRIAVLYQHATDAAGRSPIGPSREVVQALRSTGLRAWPMGVKPPVGRLVRRLDRQTPDAMVPHLDGFGDHPFGEAVVTGLLELAAIPFTGSSSVARALCKDRPRLLTLLRGAGLPVAAEESGSILEIPILDLEVIEALPPTAGEDDNRSARRLAEAAFRAVGLRDYAIVRCVVDPDGVARVADIRTAPDLGIESTWSLGLKAGGRERAETLATLVRKAIDRGPIT